MPLCTIKMFEGELAEAQTGGSNPCRDRSDHPTRQ